MLSDPARDFINGGGKARAASDRLWEVSDIVALIEAKETAAAPQVRGPYKKRLLISTENLLGVSEC
jgi:hypothetical protein